MTCCHFQKPQIHDGDTSNHTLLKMLLPKPNISMHLKNQKKRWFVAAQNCQTIIALHHWVSKGARSPSHDPGEPPSGPRKHRKQPCFPLARFHAVSQVIVPQHLTHNLSFTLLGLIYGQGGKSFLPKTPLGLIRSP